MIATSFLLAILGGVLIVSALAKLPELSSARAFLEALEVPAPAASSLLLTGLLAEFGVGVALVAVRDTRITSVAALLLTSVFVGLHLLARHRGVTTRCGCLGFLEVAGSARLDLLRTLVVAAFALCGTILAFAASPPEAMVAVNLLGLFAGIGVVAAISNVLSARETLIETRSQYKGAVD